MGKMQDPDGPPAYDETDSPPLSSSADAIATYSSVVPQPSIVALEASPPRYATITIHHWNRLRMVNFPQSVLEAVDRVAKLYYLNGVKWEFEHEQWSLKTNARACESVLRPGPVRGPWLGKAGAGRWELIGCAVQSADGAAGRYLILAILTRLSQFGYMPQTMLYANSPKYLDKDTYFLKRTAVSLPAPPEPAMRGPDALAVAAGPARRSSGSSASGSMAASAFGGMLSRLSVTAVASTERPLPDIGAIHALDTQRYSPGRRYFSLNIWRSDRMTILGCPDDGVLDGITQSLAVKLLSLSLPSRCDGD